MIKFLMLFVDGFEDTEALATMDVLLRGKDLVVKASMMGRLTVKSKSGIESKMDVLIEDVNFKEYDCLIIPGGPGSFKIMPNLSMTTKVINAFYHDGKMIAAICAAPHLLGRLGLLKGLDYTCHPGFESDDYEGKYHQECGVVVTKKIITGKSMYYSIPFGLAIHEAFHGKESRIALENSCMGEA